MKVLDTRAYLSVVQELTEAGNEVAVRIAGGSMVPFLADGRDSVCLAKPHRPLKRGDIVCYQRRDGSFVLHRICRVRPEGYYIVGDGQQELEGPVARRQIFALAVKVHRKGQWIGEENLCWRFFAGAWLRLRPFRYALLRAYGVLRGRKG
jgi:signal peptidase I